MLTEVCLFSSSCSGSHLSGVVFTDTCTGFDHTRNHGYTMAQNLHTFKSTGVSLLVIIIPIFLCLEKAILI